MRTSHQLRVIVLLMLAIAIARPALAQRTTTSGEFVTEPPTLVIRHGSRFEVLATNTLDDGFDASPALVDRDLYLRGNRYLYCIAEQ